MDFNIKEELVEKDSNLSNTTEKSPKDNLSTTVNLLSQLSHIPFRKVSGYAETYSIKPIKSSHSSQPSKDSFLPITSHQTEPGIVHVEADIRDLLATQFSQTSSDVGLKTVLQPVIASRAVRTNWSPTPLEQFKSHPHPSRTQLPGSLLKNSCQKMSPTFRSLNQSIKSKKRNNLCLPTVSFKQSVKKLKERGEMEAPTPIASMSTRAKFILPKPLCGLIETSNSDNKSSDNSENQRSSSQLSIAPLVTSQPKKGRNVKVVSMESLYFGTSQRSRFEDGSSFRALRSVQEPKSQGRQRSSRGKTLTFSEGEKRTQLETTGKTRKFKKTKQETKKSCVVMQKREPERIIVKRNLISGTFVVMSHSRTNQDIASKSTPLSNIRSAESPKPNDASKMLLENKGGSEQGKGTFSTFVNSGATEKRKITEKKQYKCRICNVTYVSFKEVQEHLLKTHSMT